MKATVIVNLRSSRTQTHVAGLRELLQSRNIEVTDFLIVNDDLKLAKRTRRAVEKGAHVLILGGGDGTMAIGVDALAKRDCTLGVLPLGTGNSFAQTLGIGEDLEKAVDIIAAARVACVDLGVVNKTHFANFSTIGLSSEIAASTSHDLKKIIGVAAYLVGAFKPFFKHESFRARIHWDNGRMELVTRQMVIANGRFFGKTPVLPDATITGVRALPRLVKIPMATTLVLFAIGIPWSRLALGAHYLTDVIGGLLFGAAWCCLQSLAAQRLQAMQANPVALRAEGSLRP